MNTAYFLDIQPIIVIDKLLVAFQFLLSKNIGIIFLLIGLIRMIISERKKGDRLVIIGFILILFGVNEPLR